MAKKIVQITHISWRDDRPRFSPGPRLRALGFKGEDLRHPDGTWFSPEEALVWAKDREKIIAHRAKEKASGKRLPKMQRAQHLSVEGLFEAWFSSPRMAGEDTNQDSKRRQKKASLNTIKDYKNKARTLQNFDAELYTSPVEALKKPICFGIYEKLCEEKGLATARGVIATLSSAISWGMKRGYVKMTVNPCEKLGMETPQPRLRAFSQDEVDQMVKASDLIGRPEIGDSIMLGVWTGQRQNDRLALMDAGLVSGRRLFKQSKTGAIVEIMEAPKLEERLKSMRARRESWGYRHLQLIIDEKLKQPFKADWYRHVFAQVRDAATAGIKGENGEWVLEPMPSLAGGRDQDLRDTAVTWLGRAGCNTIEVSQITGHSLESVTRIMKHYMAAHPEISDNAMRKLLKWDDSHSTR